MLFSRKRAMGIFAQGMLFELWIPLYLLLKFVSLCFERDEMPYLHTHKIQLKCVFVRDFVHIRLRLLVLS